MPRDVLPDSDLAATTIGNEVFTYVQFQNGSIQECRGQIDSSATAERVYAYYESTSAVLRYRGHSEDVLANAPKLFTPLGAAILRPSTRVSQSFTLLRFS